MNTTSNMTAVIVQQVRPEPVVATEPTPIAALTMDGPTKSIMFAAMRDALADAQHGHDFAVQYAQRLTTIARATKDEIDRSASTAAWELASSMHNTVMDIQRVVDFMQTTNFVLLFPR